MSSKPAQVVDWVRIFDTFRVERLTYVQLESALGIPKTTLISYANGVMSPSYTNGERIIAHWLEVTHQSLDQAPRHEAIQNGHARRRG